MKTSFTLPKITRLSQIFNGYEEIIVFDDKKILEKTIVFLSQLFFNRY